MTKFLRWLFGKEITLWVMGLSIPLAVGFAPRYAQLAYVFFVIAGTWGLGRLFGWMRDNADDTFKYIAGLFVAVLIVCSTALSLWWVKRDAVDLSKSPDPVVSVTQTTPPVAQVKAKVPDKPPAETTKPPKPRREAKPPQPQNNVTNPTGSIVNQNSPNFGSQIVSNSYGPPEPKITVSMEVLPLSEDEKHGIGLPLGPIHTNAMPTYKSRVVIGTDMLISSPGFVLTFDGPIIAARIVPSYANQLQDKEGYESTDGINANIFKFYLDFPRSFPASGNLYVYVWAEKPVKLVKCLLEK